MFFSPPASSTFIYTGICTGKAELVNQMVKQGLLRKSQSRGIEAGWGFIYVMLPLIFDYTYNIRPCHLCSLMLFKGKIRIFQF